MTFQALLVSVEAEAAAVLTPVLTSFGLSVKCCTHTEAISELAGGKFDALVVDFDDAQGGTLVLQNAYLSSPRNGMVSVALLRDQTKVRSVFGAGANFVLYKPVFTEQAVSSLRAAISLLKRERRRSLRVPVQVLVQLRVENGLLMEGVLLDLSEDGMELLAAQPLCPSAATTLQFSLPQEHSVIAARAEVAWANPNGQSGLRFVGLSEGVRSTLREWVTANARKLPAEEPELASQYQLTDISEGGCYVKTESPFPERSGVFLRLKASALEIQVQGMVRVMHPGVGMGIEFASCTAQERREVANFIRLLTSSPSTSPELVVTPRSLAALADTSTRTDGARELEDALLDLLRGHETFDQEAFLQELRQQRGSAEAAHV